MASLTSSQSSLPSSSRSSHGARVSRKLFTLALAAASIRSTSALTLNGCYSSSQPLTYKAYYNFQSPSWCNTQCAGAAVVGLAGGYDCYCGSELPPSDTQVDSSKCDIPCTGYGQDACGGNGFYTIYTNADVPHAGGGSNNNGGSNNGGSSDTSSSVPSSTPSTTPSAASTTTSTTATTSVIEPSIVTRTNPGTTIVRTVGPSTTLNPSATLGANSSSNSKGGSTPVAGIAAGVTIGVVALIAIVGGVWFLLRRRRRQQAEDDYARRHQVSDLMRGGYGERKPPSTAYSQMSDSRLEPQFGHNRNSVGSIMDNQDYSRRILRVANPDSS